MQFTDGELAYLTEMRALSTDPQGRTIFVGLDHEESIKFKRYSDTFMRREDWVDPDEYTKLSDKHEIARISVIAAESLARQTNPTKH